MTAEDIVLIDLEGNILEGELRPSSDVDTFGILSKLARIGGVVHTHIHMGNWFAQAGKILLR